MIYLSLVKNGFLLFRLDRDVMDNERFDVLDLYVPLSLCKGLGRSHHRCPGVDNDIDFPKMASDVLRENLFELGLASIQVNL